MFMSISDFNASRSGCLIDYFCMYANARIGIRSEDLKNTVDKTLGGSIFVLSSPRLIIPAVIFGLSTFSSHFHNSIFNFEVKVQLIVIAVRFILTYAVYFLAN
jgi:hypothetical protein